MKRGKLLPIIPMAFGGDVTGKGLMRRRKLMADGGEPPEDAGFTVGPGVSKYNWANPEIPAVSGTAPSPSHQGIDINNISNAILPFASNIVNGFRRPPMPATPELIRPVTLSKIRLDASRNQVRNAARAQDINADKTLDEQSAAAVRSSNLAKTLNQEGQINEQEGFLNARQRAEAAGMNLNVDSMNTAAINRQRDQQVERGLAIQREQSQNLANASDKVIGIQNERNKAKLDLQKLNTLSEMWKDSGVYNRLRNRMREEGKKDPTGVMGQMSWLGDYMDEEPTQKHAFGGPVSPLKGKHPTHASRLHRSSIGDHKVMAFGGEGPGKGKFTGTTMAASASSGLQDAQLADTINGILVSGNMPTGLDPQYRGLATSAYLWSKQNPSAGPEARISGWYARPLDVNNADDMLRGKLRNINYDPVYNYRTTPNQNLQMRQGAQPSAVTQNVAGMAFGGYRSSLAKGYLSPFGNTRSIGMGPGIMKSKFNPKHISHVPHNMLAFGGSPKADGSGDDYHFTNYGDATPDVYAMGGLGNKVVDHSMWKEPYKEWALTNNDPNLYATGGNMGSDYSGETTARDMSMWNRKQWMDEKDPGTDIYAKGGWISKAVNPAHKGYCTPMTKKTCTPRRKAFAMTMKKHHGFHCMGGALKPII